MKNTNFVIINRKVIMLSFHFYLKSTILFMLLTTCQPEKRWDCIQSTGKIVQENRILTPFDKIEVHDKIEIEIFLRNTYSVEIQAGKNLLNDIQTEVKDSTLIIRNLNRCNFMRDPSKKIHIKIFMPYLLSLQHYGYANIFLRDTLETDSVAVFNEGNGDIHMHIRTKILYGASYASGDMYFEGTATHFYYHMNGSNFLYSQNLAVKDYIYISHFSIGDAYVYPLGWLEGELRNTGNLYYKGNPVILGFKNTKGARLIQMN